MWNNNMQHATVPACLPAAATATASAKYFHVPRCTIDLRRGEGGRVEERGTGRAKSEGSYKNSTLG